MTTHTAIQALDEPSAPRRGAGRGTYLRRRLTMIAALMLAVFLLGVVVGRVGAEADAVDVVDHETVAPGETLWDVAVRTTPDGADPRRQLAALRAANDVDPGALAPWSVVVVPTP